MSQKIQTWISEMTLEEKISLLVGEDYWHTAAVPRLGIPSVCMADGPHGLRVQKEQVDNLGMYNSQRATCFPTEATISNSWDPELVYQMGQALAQEAHEQGVDVLLGPGINIKRSPLCGRNFEYFSEDPYLTAQLGIAYVRGLQSKQIGACLKHFAVNNQETRRRTINAVVDSRALREIYLYAFEKIIKEAKPWMVMSAYNKVNDSYCSENTVLLDILKRQWLFEGVVVTDWGASNNRVSGLLAGNDIEMPGKRGKGKEEILQAVKAGKITEAYIEECVYHILALVEKVNKKQQILDKKDRENHHVLAQKIAEESIVLLKNTDQLLPIKPNQKVAIIGDMAYHPRYQGIGSSKVNAVKVENVYTILQEEKIDFKYAQGYAYLSNQVDKEKTKQAIEVAKQAEVVLLFIGIPENIESEGRDRKDILLPKNQEVLLRNLLKVNPNLVVVLSGGSSIAMPWKERVKGIITGYLGGEAGAKAMMEVLWGRKNPCGKLAESYPYTIKDTPCYRYFPGTQASVEYQESIFVGYRYYITRQKNVLFPFGYGLSYTQFRYTNLQVSRKQIQLEKQEKLMVICDIQNIGKRAGKEIVQLYIHQKNPGVYKPKRELKAFYKVNLQPGEIKQIQWELDREAFSYFSVELEKWVVESDQYSIQVGSSSEDIWLQEEISVISTDNPPKKNYPKVYHRAEIEKVTKEDFEQVLGRKVPPRRLKVGTFSEENALEQMRYTWIGFLVYYYRRLKARHLIRKQKKDEATKMIQDMQKPLKKIYEKPESPYNEDMIKGFIQIVNRKRIRGIKQIQRGKYIKERKEGYHD